MAGCKKHKGLLVVFEGIDGTGKSTQVLLLAEALRQLGHTVAATREPTDGPYGRRIRELFTNRQAVSREEELELFLADRRQHVEELIAPALARGEIVLSDRYYLSTAAYQGANGMDPQEIIRRNELFAPQPDLVLLLELEPAESVHRVRTLRAEVPNDFEQESYLERVKKIFDSFGQGFIRRLSARGGIAEVHALVLETIRPLLEKRRVSAEG